MNAMLGPQQARARAILADIARRDERLEHHRQRIGQTLDNAQGLSLELSEQLRGEFASIGTPLARRHLARVDRLDRENHQRIQQLKAEMASEHEKIRRKAVEAIMSMSYSDEQAAKMAARTEGRPDAVKKAVAHQIEALDALVRLSEATIASQAAARGKGGAMGSGQPPAAASPAPRSSAGGSGKKPSQWSFGDLLARVAETENEEPPLPAYRPATATTTHDPASSIELDPMDVLRMDDIARALDSHTALLAWKRYQSGERNVFSRRLYNSDGQQTFDRLSQSYQNDQGMRQAIEKYVSDFEQIMAEAEEKDPSGRVIQNYLSSENGRVYLMLAHISGRLG